MQTQLQLGSYIHACTNDTRFLVNLQDLIPTLQEYIYKQHKPAKVGIKSHRFATVCFL